MHSVQKLPSLLRASSNINRRTHNKAEITHNKPGASKKKAGIHSQKAYRTANDNVGITCTKINSPTHFVVGPKKPPYILLLCLPEYCGGFLLSQTKEVKPPCTNTNQNWVAYAISLTRWRGRAALSCLCLPPRKTYSSSYNYFSPTILLLA